MKKALILLTLLAACKESGEIKRPGMDEWFILGRATPRAKTLGVAGLLDTNIVRVKNGHLLLRDSVQDERVLNGILKAGLLDTLKK
jgi:hypothetical protein